MERTAQRGLLAQIAGFVRQNLEGLQAVIHDFAGFLQEDGQKLIVAVQIYSAQFGCRHRSSRRHARRSCDCRCQIPSDIRLVSCLLARLHARKHLSHGIGQGIGAHAGRLCHGWCGYCLKLGQGTWLGHCPRRGVLVLDVPDLQLLWLRHSSGNWPHFDRRWRCGDRGLHYRISNHGSRSDRSLSRRRYAIHGNIHGGTEGFGATTAAMTHDDAQFVLFLVIDEQLARHIALVAEHVDEKAHGTETAAQLLEDARLVLDRHLAEHQMLDGVTHALHGGRGLLESQHRQHTTHLRHLARYRGQHRGVRGIAKEQIQLLLSLAKGDAQLSNHRPHGLLVAGLTVELLHPDFQRLGLRAMQSRIQTLDQHAGLGGLYFVVMPGSHEAGLQIQHRGRHLHGQLGWWRLANALHRLRHTNQRARQPVTDRLQLDQRLGHQSELLGHGSDLAAVATRYGRPGLGGGRNALARLHQHRGIEAAIARHVVVHHRHLLHGIGLVYGLQTLTGLLAGLGLRAKEHQVLQQARGRQAVALGHAGVLHEHARSHALDVDIGSDESTCQAVEEGRSDFPETARRHIFGLSCRKAPAKLAHLGCRLAVVALDHAQHHTVQHGTCMWAIGQRLRHGPGPAGLACTALGRP